MLVAAALLLVGAAPASAVTGGFGVAKSLRGLPLPVSFPKGDERQGQGRRVCGEQLAQLEDAAVEGGQRAREAVPARRVRAAAAQRASSPNDALKHATAAALAILG